MIWSVVTKKEMEEYNIPPVFQYYREVIGRENITLAVVDDNDPLTFVHDDDVVLLRSASKSLIETIERKGVKTTAERFRTYELVRDKATLSALLRQHSIPAPHFYAIHEVIDGKVYFVKPRFGSESFGITPECICQSKQDVLKQITRIEQETKQSAMIEDFIDGTDCTTACYYNPFTKEVRTHTIRIENNEIGGIQTHTSKFNYDEYCSALKGKKGDIANKVSKEVFELLGIKHHARIDYRIANDGKLYLIDVNLIPGLGPSAHFAKCLLLTDNISYMDTVKSIVRSAQNHQIQNL